MSYQELPRWIVAGPILHREVVAVSEGQAVLSAASWAGIAGLYTVARKGASRTRLWDCKQSMRLGYPVWEAARFGGAA